MFHPARAQFRLRALLLQLQPLLPVQSPANRVKSSRRKKPFGSISLPSQLPRPQSRFPRPRQFTPLLRLPRLPLQLPLLPPLGLPPPLPRLKKLPHRRLPQLHDRPLGLLLVQPRRLRLLEHRLLVRLPAAVAWIWWTRFWPSLPLWSPWQS